MPTTTPRRRERMRSVDAAWLHMDRPTNLMVINSIWLMDGAIAEDRLRAVVSERLVARYPRFRQRVIEGRPPLGRPSWEEDQDFDLGRHFHRIGLPVPGEQRALQRLIADLMASPLDHSKPLWDLYLIDGPGEASTVYTRVHHCIADGIALASVMLSLTDSLTATKADAALARAPAPARGRTAAAASAARSVATTVVHEGLESVAHPRHVARLGTSAARDVTALARLLLMPTDADTALRGRPGTGRAVAWTTPLPLHEIKEIARAQRATVNDVLLAAISGALRRYLLDLGEPPTRLRAIVPFNLRPLDRPVPVELGNHFGLVYLELPVDVRDRRARLGEVKRGMDAIKASPDGPLTYAVLAAMGLGPAAIEARGVDLFSAKGTAVMTNVPGPTQPISLAGTPIRAALVWAPCSGSVGMSVSILSYRGEVTVGLMVDAHLVPDPQRIVHAIEREVAALGRLKAAPERPTATASGRRATASVRGGTAAPAASGRRATSAR